MADLIDELVRVPEHLVRNSSDEAQPSDQAGHLVLLHNLHLIPQFLLEHFVELVSSSSCSHDLDSSLHLCDGNSVELSRLSDERLDEGDAEVDLGGFEPSEVEETSWEVREMG